MSLPLPPTNTPVYDESGIMSEPWRRYWLALQDSIPPLTPPVDARYWLSEAAPILTNEQNIGLLSSGYLKITTAIGAATPSSVSAIPAGDLAPGGTFPAIDGSNLTGVLKGPGSSVDHEMALFSGTTGNQLTPATGTGVVRVTSGVYGTPGPVQLVTEVIGRLQYTHFVQATAASRLLGRRSTSAGDYEEVTLGTNMSMSGTTLNAAAVPSVATSFARTFLLMGA